MADFVEVVSWHTDQDEVFYPSDEYGSLKKKKQINHQDCLRGFSIFFFVPYLHSFDGNTNKQTKKSQW